MPVFSQSFDDIAEELFSPKEVIAALKNQQVVIVSQEDPVSLAFAEAAQGKLQRFARVVRLDQKIIQGEVDRQLSGLVDDNEVRSIGNQYRAEIVVQLILCRTRDNQVKYRLMAVQVKRNYLAAQNIVIKSGLPRGWENKLQDLPREGESPTDEIKRAVLALLKEKISGGVQDDPEPVKLVEPFDFSRIFRNAFWGISVGVGTLDSDSSFHLFGLEYGRIGESWLPADRLWFEIAPLSFYKSPWGFDLAVGYRLWSMTWEKGRDFFNIGIGEGLFDNALFALVTASFGFALIPSDIDDSAFIPYFQIAGSFTVLSLALRFTLFTENISSGAVFAVTWKQSF
ncbi:hypothetical protein ACYULU_00335 [Breznakiellaceae bacterium SP9]